MTIADVVVISIIVAILCYFGWAGDRRDTS